MSVVPQVRDTEIALRQGIILRASHVGIAAPSVYGPNPGAAGSAQIPSVPSFTRPTISLEQFKFILSELGADSIQKDIIEITASGSSKRNGLMIDMSDAPLSSA